MEVQRNKRSKNIFVSFSKRRKGLFHKASELSSKCDAQIAILVLSPSENPFAFGHSSIDDVLRRYNESLIRPNGSSSTSSTIINAVMKERVKRKAGELEELRVRVREKERIGRESFDLSLISDEDIENCNSIESLESYRVAYSNLLRQVREKLLGCDNSVVFNLLHRPQNDVSFSLVKSRDGTTNFGVDHDRRVNENYVSFPVAKREDYGGASSSCGGCGFGRVDIGSLEVMVDEKNDKSPLIGSGTGSCNVGVESNDIDLFGDHDICCGTGFGDDNLDFLSSEESLKLLQDMDSLGNGCESNNLLLDEQNDMSFWFSNSYL